MIKGLSLLKVLISYFWVPEEELELYYHKKKVNILELPEKKIKDNKISVLYWKKKVFKNTIKCPIIFKLNYAEIPEYAL
jgi:hypothetical protein